MNSNIIHYLPTYEETIIPYSLRLPTYRSSYIRRFHPYARYTTPPADDCDMDGTGEEPLLNLSTLGERIPVPGEVTTTDERVIMIEVQGRNNKDRGPPKTDEAPSLVVHPGVRSEWKEVAEGSGRLIGDNNVCENGAMSDVTIPGHHVPIRIRLGDEQIAENLDRGNGNGEVDDSTVVNHEHDDEDPVATTGLFL
ncbi:hypothetical protein AX15_006416 [Amanita polypyramis BW_CC]|nr:hypothetical protein AX15_006416 [Amanita polypyramis BW_CC]